MTLFAAGQCSIPLNELLEALRSVLNRYLQLLSRLRSYLQSHLPELNIHFWPLIKFIFSNLLAFLKSF